MREIDMETDVRVNVIKRSGEEVTFDAAKIVNAVRKANQEVDRIHRLSDYQIAELARTGITGLMMGEMIYSMKLKSKPRSRRHMIPTPAVQVTAIMAAMIMKAVTAVITTTGATRSNWEIYQSGLSM